MEVDQTVSVSKGIFIFKNNFKTSLKKSKSRKKLTKTKTLNKLFSSNSWYQHYFDLWNTIDEEIQLLNNSLFSSVLSNLIEFIKTSHNDYVEEIPTAAFFTGINMPDHEAQFTSLSNQLERTTTPHIANMLSQDCQNIKYFMENMINQFVSTKEDCYLFEEDEVNSNNRINRSQLTMSLLVSWYRDLYKESDIKKPLVVIIPDFESFNSHVLQLFILIISGYIKTLPFVLVLGIATDINTLHNSLPYRVSSRLRVKVLHSQKSTEYLNNVLENVLFSSVCPFQLGGNVFNLFIELFLFYDFSVNNFIQNFKYAMLDHFSSGNDKTLCHLDLEVVIETLKSFSEDDFKSVRELGSFKKLVEMESQENQIKLMIDDGFLSNILIREIPKVQNYIKRLFLYLKCLLVLVKDLPRAPLGKQLRELYSISSSKNITEVAAFKECMKLLEFQSRDELSEKLSKIINIIKSEKLNDTATEIFVKLLQKYQLTLQRIETDETEEDIEIIDEDSSKTNKLTDKLIEGKLSSRIQFKEKLLELAKTPNKSLNKYEKLRKDILENISKVFEKLKHPEAYYFHEIFFYNNMAIKNYIIGSHRSAIHNALNDPHFYLRCECCETSNSPSIKLTMPDVCIAYKLHLEYGKMINLYDWLQSFISIIDPDANYDDAAQIVIKPEMQARFTQTVAELEFLGFIKSSKRKADHVQRLTWGG